MIAEWSLFDVQSIGEEPPFGTNKIGRIRKYRTIIPQIVRGTWKPPFE